MSKKRNLIFICLLILGIFLLTSCLPKPPVTEGILKGQVIVPEGTLQAKDLTGQALPNATVNIIDPATGAIIATTTTDANGYYQVFVPAGGPHILQAVKDGVVVLQITPQVEVGIEYDLGTADCSTTAVALIAQAMLVAEDYPNNIADINLTAIEADPNFNDVMSPVCSIIEAGEDPALSAVVQQAVEDFLYPPAPAPTPTPTPTYTVTFDSQGGSAVDPQKVKHGRKATEPTAPTWAGHTFGGWYKEPGCTNAWDFDTDKVTSDVTLYARWTINTYTVTFDSQGGSPVSSQTVEHGGKATEPTAPTRTGYTFGGWYKEPGCTNPWDFDTDKVTSNVTLYARWTINTYTVTFDSQGGSPVSSQTVEHGGKATEPTAPTRTGYTFGGWYKESGCTNAWDFDTDKVTSNVTLYARWTINTYTVTFDSQGGSPVSSQTVEHGGKATEPMAPTRTGYTFGGWYKEPGCTNPWDFDTDKVTSNVTLYARWTINTYTVTYNGNGNTGGTVPVDPSSPYEYGATVTVLSKGDLVNTGHTFAGWNTQADGNGTDRAVGSDFIMGVSDVTLFAKWTGPVHNITKNIYYTAIQAALTDADTGDIIEADDGTYTESITFPAGKVITLRSVNGASSTTITGANGSATVTCSNSPDGTTLEGFTISHNPADDGEGICISGGYLTINNCTISGNSNPIDDGGGIYTEGTLTITGSTISNNSANNGGGIAICQSSPTITDNTISGNNSVTNGGGIYIHDNSSPTITDNTISGNNSGTNGKGGGIAIYSNCSPTITYNTISGNTGKYGGGISIHGISVLPPIITDNTISGNNSDNGGGIYITNNSSPDIKSNTISGNECTNNGGGIYVTATSSPDIKSNTISGNECTNNGGGIYVSGTSNLSTIGGADGSDTGNFNNICGNTPDQIDPDTYPNNYISDYCIGDAGPAGGWIFYDDEADGVDDIAGARYLEAAPGDQSASAQWGCHGTLISGADGTAVGTGEQNTIDILAGCTTTGIAADICANLILGGYDDWFLPSQDELNLMYTNLHNSVPSVGGFADSQYWSSSEYDANFARYQNFANDFQAHYHKSTSERVRAVRAF